MNNFFPILSIETSGELCSVSVHTDNNTYSEFNINKKHIHSEIIMNLIDQSLKSIAVSLEQLKVIAVSMGPGSFTGLRIGMAAAKSIAYGCDIPIIPVDTFSAFAFDIFSINPKFQKIAIITKVNSLELYLEKFVRNGTNSDNYISNGLEIIKMSEFDKKKEDFQLFGNYSHNEVINAFSISAKAIANWAYIFGQDLLTFDYDYLQPNYIKNFVAKVKK